MYEIIANIYPEFFIKTYLCISKKNIIIGSNHIITDIQNISIISIDYNIYFVYNDLLYEIIFINHKEYDNFIINIKKIFKNITYNDHNNLILNSKKNINDIIVEYNNIGDIFYIGNLLDKYYNKGLFFSKKHNMKVFFNDFHKNIPIDYCIVFLNDIRYYISNINKKTHINIYNEDFFEILLCLI